MKNSLLITFFVLHGIVIVQAQNWLWAKSAGGTYGDHSQSVSSDATGNVFVTGNFHSPSMTFGSTTVTNAGSYDVFIAKYDASGNVLWAKSAGGTMQDVGFALSTDPVGNVFVTGYFFSPTMSFGSVILTNVDPTGNTIDVFIAKYDANGNIIWAKSAGGSVMDSGHSVNVDLAGNVVVTGTFNSSSISFGSTTLTTASAGWPDVFITKYDANGNILWAKSIGGTGGGAVNTDVNGNVFIVGYFGGPTITFGSTTLTNVSGGSHDIFIAKYDKNGNALWANSAGGTNYDQSSSVTSDAVGNVLVTGYFASSSITFGSTTLTNAGGGDVFIAKYDKNGNVLWAKSAGGISSDEGYSISRDTSDNVFVTGRFDSPSITFESTTFAQPLGSIDPMFIVKYDGNGNFLCGSTLASGGSKVNSASTDPFGNAYIGGAFSANPFMIGSDTLTPISGDDIFVAKYMCSCGFTASINGNTTICLGSATTLNASGGTEYLWNTGATTTSINVSPSSNTAYSVSASIGSCKDDTSAIVTVNPLPIVTANATATTVNAGTSVTLTGGGASSYSWTGGIVDGIGFIPTSTTTYAVLGFDANNCYNTAVITIYVINTTGIDEMANNNQLSVYPNPSSDKFTILSAEKISSIEVMNLLGEKIFMIAVNDKASIIDLSPQPKGIYFMEIISGSERVVKKIVLN